MHAEARLLMCMSCKYAMAGTLDGITQHFHTYHRKKGYVVEASKLAISLKDLEPLAELPDLSLKTTPIAPIDGLKPPFDGEQCPDCSYFDSHRGLVSHYKKQHSRKYKRGMKFNSVLLQKLDNDKRRPAFLVEEPEPLDVSTPANFLASIKADFLAFDAFLLEEGGDRDFRRISAFLAKTGWYKIVKGYDAKELCALVEDLGAEYLHIRNAILDYFAHATVLLDTTEPLVLKYLNTSHPPTRYTFTHILCLAI